MPLPHEVEGSTCFQNWMAQQKADLEELQQTLLRDGHDEEKLRFVVSKSLEHYKDYTAQRSKLSQEDPPSLFCPGWCTSFENSFMWAAGCRPSLCIRLAYVLSGSQLQAQLEEFLRGVRRGNLAELSAEQLAMVNDLHGRTVREEDDLSGRLARLQEDVADDPLVTFATDGARSSASSSSMDEVDGAMNAHACSLGEVLKEADNLRVATLTQLIDIFTPRQAVDFLIAAKQLHLSFSEWGKRRDRRHGNTSRTT